MRDGGVSSVHRPRTIAEFIVPTPTNPMDREDAIATESSACRPWRRLMRGNATVPPQEFYYGMELQVK
eukprot:5230274-Prymnesium_polylepis.1